MGGSGSGSGCSWILRLVLILQLVGGIYSWGKEGHYATCKIAEIAHCGEEARPRWGPVSCFPRPHIELSEETCTSLNYYWLWNCPLKNEEWDQRSVFLQQGSPVATFTSTSSLLYSLKKAKINATIYAKPSNPLPFLVLMLLICQDMPNVACIDTLAFLAHLTVRSAALQVMTTFLSVFIYGCFLLWGALVLETPSHHNNMLSLRNAMLIHCLALIFGSGAYGWSKEGHAMTCQIAQSLLKPDVAEAVRHLLPAYAKGDLSSLCTWPDQIRHWHKYLWTSSLHFIDTPDNVCSFDYLRDCHDQHGLKNMCVAGALQNFTSQLLHYKEGTADRRYNMTEALLFLSHFMGDIHQPMHVGFSSDEGGNTIELHWFRRKSNLHHVWDRDIILTAAADYYEKDMSLLLQDIEANFTDGVWSDDTSSWTNCEDLLSCPIEYASESISLACKWAYKGVQPGVTLADDYFDSRMPVVMKRIAQGGVRLAMILNRVLGADTDEGFTSPT